MSFDKDTRKLLAKMVAACRRRLVQDVTDQLRGVFGLHPDGTILPLDKLMHLSPDQTAAARRLRDLLDHYTSGASGKEPERRKTAYERVVLEISFTLLNRLAALRLCEERGLVIECVRQGTASAGFQMFERISGGALGGRYDTYWVFLECLFDELALDLGVLFDRMTPQSAVLPTERCMEDVLTELNKPELAHLWTEDETIGWVYQYFNPPEERKAMRDASQAPRNSRELAVRNQFFTPRYVVEFLTDNTLGRIWFEMTRGETALKDSCHYMVRRPTEIFLCEGEETPAQEPLAEEPSQEELLRQPVYVPLRPLKDPREIKMLDPACGSMHFGLYAFDLFERIYEEAWELEERLGADALIRPVDLEPLHHTFPDKEAFLRDVPRLIIESNIHGIDIDPRAVQIAALALWLRAQKTWKNHGIKASDRPRIAKSNIVTAEPMPGEEDMRREFIACLSPRVLGQLVDVVFDKMKLAGDAGSLLKIEEEINDAVADARKQWLDGPKPEQHPLFHGFAAPQPKRQELRFDAEGVTDERFWEGAEDRILDALKNYAERAENGHTTRRRLFANDAARGFAFIDLCRKRYDVVLMNPPFGAASQKLEDYLEDGSDNWSKNLACAFMERIRTLTLCDGMNGAICDNSTAVRSSYEGFRNIEFLSHGLLHRWATLGWEVLDAAVETYAMTRSIETTSEQDIVGFHLVQSPADQRESILLESIQQGLHSPIVHCVSINTLRRLPNSVIDLSWPDFLVEAFRKLPSLEEAGTPAYVGHQLEADRHYRLYWELAPNMEISPQSRWSFAFKGGDYSPGYLPDLYVGLLGKSYSEVPEKSSNVLRNMDLHFREGIGYGKRGEFVDAQPLRPTSFFTHEGFAFIVGCLYDKSFIFALLNSDFFSYGVNKYCGQHKTNGYVNLFPVASRSQEKDDALANTMRDITELKSKWGQSEEIDYLFCGPIIETSGEGANLTQRIDSILSMERQDRNILENLWKRSNGIIDDYYEISEDSKKEIKAFCSRRPAYELRDWWCGTDDIGKAASLVKELVSYYFGVTLGAFRNLPFVGGSTGTYPIDAFSPLPAARPCYPESSENHGREYGLAVDAPDFTGAQPQGGDIIHRVRAVLDRLWKDKAQEIEQQACDILGVSDLSDYFRKPTGFFQDHLKRYSKSRRKAPIYWPLSTASGAYTVWLYYHRLTDQTLYAVVNSYLEPKISETGSGIARMQDELKSASGRDASRLMDRLNEGRTFLGELRDLREELLRIAALPFKPDLNDGVIINAAPFHNLFRLRSWAKDTEECWNRLSKGEYDWAHLAYTIWPERVREVCKKDRSIAIAHGLEDRCEVAAPAPKRTGGSGRRSQT